MRYSFGAAALLISVAVAHVHEDLEGPTEGEAVYHIESTAYSTAQVTITACDSTVKDCPFASHTSVPVIETPHPAVPVSHPAVSTFTPVPPVYYSSVEVPVESHFSGKIPLYPTAPSVSSLPLPVGTAPAGSACLVCPAPVTIYSTITSIPIPAPTGGPIPSVPISGIESVPVPSGSAPVGTGASSGL
jgi:hypothetical protein